MVNEFTGEQDDFESHFLLVMLINVVFSAMVSAIKRLGW